MGAASDSERALVLEDLGQFNLLIGPNNSGKSIAFRFLHLISPLGCRFVNVCKQQASAGTKLLAMG